MDGAAEIGGSNVRSGSGAAVEVDVTDGGRGDVGPGVVAGIVGVVEGHSVPGHGVVVINKAAEEDLGLAVADTVSGVADGAGSCLDDVGKVGYRRGVFGNVVAGDFGAGGGSIEQCLDGCGFYGQGRVVFRLNNNFLGHRSECELEIEFLLAAVDGDGPQLGTEARGADSQSVAARGDIAKEIDSWPIGESALHRSARGIFEGHRGADDDFPGGVSEVPFTMQLRSGQRRALR